MPITVGDLIEELRQYGPTLEVVLSVRGSEAPEFSVELAEGSPDEAPVVVLED